MLSVRDRLQRLNSRTSPLAWLTFGIRVIGYLGLFLLTPADGELSLYVTSHPVTFGFNAVLLVLGVFAFFSRTERTFRTLMLSHTAITLLILMIGPLNPVIALIHYCVLALAAGVHERLPQNLIYALVLSLAVAAVFLVRLPSEGAMTGGLGFVMISVAVPASVLTHFREQIIPLQQQIRHLMSNVEHLTRANSLTQDYARDIEEESRNEERMKLARDIHDLVGYTFTNAIMMTEAAKVMTRQEPGRIVEFMERIRGTMEDGLVEVKQALRDLRTQERPPQHIDTAMRKLVRVFSISTGVDVRVEYGNADWDAFEPFADCVYHFVQEGLINAFRHGGATRVTVFLWARDTSYEVRIDDNGAGAPATIAEGIGIAGMRERVTALGGSLTIHPAVVGFSLTMTLPRLEDECPDRFES